MRWIQGGRKAVADLGGSLGNLEIWHITLSNYTKRALFHFVILRSFLAGGGHPFLHHPCSGYTRTADFVAFILPLLLPGFAFAGSVLYNVTFIIFNYNEILSYWHYYIYIFFYYTGTRSYGNLNNTMRKTVYTTVQYVYLYVI